MWDKPCFSIISLRLVNGDRHWMFKCIQSLTMRKWTSVSVRGSVWVSMRVSVSVCPALSSGWPFSIWPCSSLLWRHHHHQSRLFPRPDCPFGNQDCVSHSLCGPPFTVTVSVVCRWCRVLAQLLVWNVAGYICCYLQFQYITGSLCCMCIVTACVWSWIKFNILLFSLTH